MKHCGDGKRGRVGARIGTLWWHVFPCSIILDVLCFTSIVWTWPWIDISLNYLQDIWFTYPLVCFIPVHDWVVFYAAQNICRAPETMPHLTNTCSWSQSPHWKTSQQFPWSWAIWFISTHYLTRLEKITITLSRSSDRDREKSTRYSDQPSPVSFLKSSQTQHSQLKSLTLRRRQELQISSDRNRSIRQES